MKGRRPQNRPTGVIRPWRWLTIVLLAAVLMGAAIWGWRILADSGRSSAPEPVSVEAPPEIPSEGADPAVIAAIGRERQAVLAEPTSPERWGALGMTLLAHEFDQQAGECFSQATALDPQDARWPYLHAHALLDTVPEDAVGLLQHAVELVGNEPGAVRLTLVELLLQLHQLDEAERQLNAYLIDHRGDVRARLAQARLEFMRGDNQVCLDHLQQLVDYARRQDNTQGPLRSLLSLMAQAQTRLGQTEQAEATQRLAESQSDARWSDPFYDQVTDRQTGLKANLVEADLMFGRGEYDQVINLLERTIDAYPDSIWAKIHLARALIRTGATDSKRPDAAERLQRAEQVLDDVLKLDADSVEAVFRLGVVKGYQGNFAEAARLYEHAIDLKPDFTMAYFNLANCRARLNDPQAAIAALTTAIAIEPNFVDAHSALGQLFMRQQRYAEAAEQFETAGRLKPNDPQLTRFLGEARQQLRNLP